MHRSALLRGALLDFLITLVITFKGSDMLGYVGIGSDMLGYAGICWDRFGYAGICWDMLGYVWICRDMLGYLVNLTWIL